MVLVSRDRAIHVRDAVTVAQVTTTIREIPLEVRLGPEEGLPKPCVVNGDVLLTIPKALLSERVALLSYEKREALNRALRFALALD